MRKLFVMLLLLSGYASAHQWTPTYPKLESSYVQGVLEAKMALFNKRNDVEYYEIGVFDSSWNPIPFASAQKLINVKYLETKRISVYIRETDRNRVTYICTRSRLKSSDTVSTVISSRICSKVK